MAASSDDSRRLGTTSRRRSLRLSLAPSKSPGIPATQSGKCVMDTTPARMIEAVKAGDVPAIREILVSNPELSNARNEEGISTILLAVYHGHAEIVELLLEKALHLNIFEAAAVGDAKRIRTLLGADVNQVNSYARMAGRHSTSRFSSVVKKRRWLCWGKARMFTRFPRTTPATRPCTRRSPIARTTW